LRVFQDFFDAFFRFQRPEHVFALELVGKSVEEVVVSVLWKAGELVFEVIFDELGEIGAEKEESAFVPGLNGEDSFLF
jgi:hypothetical protein